MIIIRLMQEKDIEAVSEIETYTFSMPWSPKSFLEAIRREGNIYLVAEYRGNIVGYCGLWKIEEEADITNVAVDSEWRGLRIGKTMLLQLIIEGKKAGIESFTLEVRESNTVARNLYESLDFESVGMRKNFYVKPTENAIIMRKR